jgi:exopolyphosphatase/guanosine-5'-triphosphate,3'-diphosphate pyrophosphatase
MTGWSTGNDEDPSAALKVEQAVRDPLVLAIVDVGSNTGRVDVVRLEFGGHLAMLGDARAALRLVRDLGAVGALEPTTIERTVSALRGFHAVAYGLGASRIIAVATSAVREAPNGEALLTAIRANADVEVAVIDGEREALFGFMGAVYGIPVEHGLVVDIGGGSVQLTQFRDRQQLTSWSLALGALRLSDQFLTSDPPSRSEIERLRRHARQTIARAAVPRLGADDRLVGTGGTIRNLARIDRKSRPYPIPRLHGYAIHRSRVREVATLLAAVPFEARAGIPGLNQDRADSIVGGALVAQTIMEAVGASDVHVSGHGLREGLALDALVHQVPSTRAVRAASIRALASRFATFDTVRARRRTDIAATLLSVLDPSATDEMRDTLDMATTLLDVGRSVDYYNRHDHAARIILAADLSGISHRSIALVALAVQLADDAGDLRGYEPLLHPTDQPALNRIAAILDFADRLEQLIPLAARGVIDCERKRDDVAVAAAVLDPWPLGDAQRRLGDTFGVKLSVQRTLA